MPSEPKYGKTILCLANSRRPGGTCVAGKEFVNGKFGSWIRPVNPQNADAISGSDRQYQDGTHCDVLDMVTVYMVEAKPHGHQTENHAIDPKYYWAKQSRATWDQIISATDKVNGPLWHDGDRSFHGLNDKVPEAVASNLKGSLLLIEPEKLDLVVALESRFDGGEDRRVRANFRLNGVHYSFVVTDPWIEAKYFAGKDGVYPIEGSRLCISLAEVAHGIATKLAAAVITKDRLD